MSGIAQGFGSRELGDLGASDSCFTNIGLTVPVPELGKLSTKQQLHSTGTEGLRHGYTIFSEGATQPSLCVAQACCFSQVQARRVLNKKRNMLGSVLLCFQ